MRLLKPDWVTHTGYPIFSIDIHPDGSRFATGGGDNKVIIWAMAPVQYEEQEANGSCPRKLAELTYHMSPVSCVRWSHNGQFLASGSDDALVMLWKLSAGPASRSFGSDELTQENWRCTSTLRGHSKDITDIAWSPDDHQLVSCSVDNELLVWDTSKNCVVAKLSGHNGFVKGVVWDPMGRYIASQSEDKSMVIWRCSDWKMEHKIEEPFTKSAATTFYRRPSWSPDGQYISCAHAYSGMNHVAQIVARDSWNEVCNFVGHKLPIVVTRFNPVIFADSTGINYGVCLIGGQDSTISVWTTVSARPLLALNTSFKQSVLDASWSKDGFTFMCCSTDGTVVWAEFAKGELGTALTPKEMDKMLKNIYGDHILSRPKSTVTVAEDPSQLYLPKPSAAPSKPAPTLPPPMPTKQVETRLANGKRRIQPQYLGQVSSTAASTTPFVPPPSPFSSTSSSSSSSSSSSISAPSSSTSTASQPITTPTSTTSVTAQTNGSSMQNGTTTASNGTSSSVHGTSSTPNGVNTNTSNGATTTTNGATTTTSTSSAPISFTTRTPPQRSPSPSPVPVSVPVPALPSTSTTSTTTTAFVPPANTGSKSNSPVAVRHNVPLPDVGKRKESDDVVEVPPPAKKQKKDNEDDKIDKEKTKEEKEKEPEKDKEQRRKVRTEKDAKEKARKEKEAAVKEVTPPVSKERPHSTRTHTIAPALHAPKLSKVIWEPLGSVLETKTEITGTQISNRCSKYPQQSWRTSIPGKAVLVCGNNTFSAVAMDDCTVYIFSPVGRLLFPPLSLSSPLSFLEANKSTYLAAITSDCLLHVWNVAQQSATVSAQPINISPHNTGNLLISHLAIGDNGQPAIICASHTYIFHSDMKVWMRVDAPSSSSGVPGGFMTNLLAIESGNRNVAAMTQENDEALGGLLKMESQLAASLAVGSSIEYKYWLLTYVRYLSSEADVNRLTEVCKSLLGPPTATSTSTSASAFSSSSTFPSGSDIPTAADFAASSAFSSSTPFSSAFGSSVHTTSKSSWEPTVLGMPKRELLRELLPIMSANRSLQRLVAQFKGGLDAVGK